MALFVTRNKIWNAINHFRSVRIASRRFISKLEMFHKRLCAEEIGRHFVLSDYVLMDVVRQMSEAMSEALSSSHPSAATVKCINTYVDYPLTPPADSMSVSRFLSLGLVDGVRFRTQLTTISDTNDVSCQSAEYPMPDDMKTGPGSKLFDQAADVLAQFADLHGVRRLGLPLAFTFGFPVRQTTTCSAVLQRWTKGFNCANVVNQDVVKLLREALGRADIEVGPVAVLNDAWVSMLKCLSDVPTSRIGLVVDDGCNCCYAENVDNVRNQRCKNSNSRQTIINTEWGAFGEDGILLPIQTKYDKDLDARSRHPGKQIFEKMISGMYMAELVRQFVLEMTVNKVLFNGCVTPAMETEYCLKALHLSQIESDSRGSYASARAVVTDVFDVKRPTEFDCELLRYACECVSKRSAHLVAAGLTSILLRLKPALVTFVAVEGSVFRTHPKYPMMVECKTSKLMENYGFSGLMGTSVLLGIGGGGALLLAGILAKMSKDHKK